MQLHIKDENSQLKTVILGLAEDFGSTPALEQTYDPWSRYCVKAGIFPTQAEVIESLKQFEAVLTKHGVQVLHPHNIPGLNQIFMRDIGFVIDDTFVISHVIADRAQEIEGIQSIIEQIPADKKLYLPEDVYIEGGDVIVWHGNLFIGYSQANDFHTYQTARTNQAGVDFLKQHFPHYQIHGFELNKSDHDHQKNVLHLDCCFQPISEQTMLLARSGFKHAQDCNYLEAIFEDTIEIDYQHMSELNSNLFSIAPKVVVSDQRFKTLNQALQQRGFTVETVGYHAASKMSGLFRCSTLPLVRL